MKKTVLILLFSIYSVVVFGQNGDAKGDTVNAIRNANNLASGNFKDVLTSFFQIAYNDLTTGNRELNFASNIFAIKLKTDPSLNIDKNFVKQTFARNSNLEFSLKLDENFSFNGFKGGYKYAIINQRDYAISRTFNILVLESTQNYTGAFININKEITRMYPNDEGGKATALIQEINAFFNTPTKFYNHLSDEAKGLIDNFFDAKAFNISSTWNPRADLNTIYQTIVDEYQKKLLWTAACYFSTYSDGVIFSNIDFETEAVAGIIPINDKNNIEFSVRANYGLANDTTKTSRSLNRQVLDSDFGLNWVARNKKDKPVFEFRAAGGFNWVPQGLYPGEERTKFLLSATLRVRITNDIWIPVDIEYDPVNDNVLGFLNVRSNFDLLNRLFGTLRK